MTSPSLRPRAAASAGPQDLRAGVDPFSHPEVIDLIARALREDVGDFETLLYVGIDWQDRDLARNSMIKLAEKVLPLLEAAQSPRPGKVATAGRS